MFHWQTQAHLTHLSPGFNCKFHNKAFIAEGCRESVAFRYFTGEMLPLQRRTAPSLICDIHHNLSVRLRVLEMPSVFWHPACILRKFLLSISVRQIFQKPSDCHGYRFTVSHGESDVAISRYFQFLAYHFIWYAL